MNVENCKRLRRTQPWQKTGIVHLGFGAFSGACYVLLKGGYVSILGRLRCCWFFTAVDGNVNASYYARVITSCRLDNQSADKLVMSKLVVKILCIKVAFNNFFYFLNRYQSTFLFNYMR